MLKPAAVRITARASITRYDANEGTIEEIVGSYNHPPEDNALIYAQIVAFRPDIQIGS